MKKLIPIILITAIIIAIFLIPGKEHQAIITIPEGSSVSEIAAILKDNDLIASKLYFKSRVNKTEGFLKAGTYTLSSKSGTDEIIEILKKGVIEEYIKLTVPEGFSVENIAKRVEELGICTEKEFLTAANSLDYDFEFLKHINPKENVNYKLSGFLYPNTYFVSHDAAARDVVEILLAEFEKQLSTINVSYDKLYEAVTVASLLEREALVKSEKPIIAGVIYNRLDKNMLLQIDAAVVYAVTEGRYDINAVYNSHLKSDSPYNLYKFTGLPPGPICNPSISSVAAAVAPQKHEFLYYRTDEKKNDGSHVFTKTFDQHLNANN